MCNSSPINTYSIIRLNCCISIHSNDSATEVFPSLFWYIIFMTIVKAIC